MSGLMFLQASIMKSLGGLIYKLYTIVNWDNPKEIPEGTICRSYITKEPPTTLNLDMFSFHEAHCVCVLKLFQGKISSNGNSKIIFESILSKPLMFWR